MNGRIGIGMMVVALLATPAQAQTASVEGLDALLREVQSAAAEGRTLNREREARFLRDKNEQAAMLREAEADKRKADARIATVRQRFEAQQREVQALKTQLRDNVGELDQMYAGIRQAAGDLRALAADSLITAQNPTRLELLDQLASGRELPGIPELEQLWVTLLEQMTESGRSVRFEAPIVNAEGLSRTAEVVRVGTFTAFADGEYLVLDEQARLVALPRQPSRSLRGLAADFSETQQGAAPVLIDPSRGALLSVEADKPDLLERVQQGGAVGYVILVLGLIGVLIAVGQLLYLIRTGSRMRRQAGQLDQPRQDNPLGRVLATFRDDAGGDDDPELLELRLSEAVLRETPSIERAQSILKLFAAVAPLLGLLGTVTGMIATFQAITVFGTGDPKLMAGGISQALVTTVLGLVVAIPLLFVNSLLNGRSRVLIQVLDEQSAVLLAQRLEGRRD
ncbi:MotA/TolQ/ExbB proton channel family protein [Flagellatimonas centrodinii]|uniref:MotA/TolQ/ExbB proton channel family protein n=1 Tax=Flagellatimonas centrodinii TaxID=2806210 RepID=UPI001FEF2815|nr:MotA/TolQ/ExbB proton channel family protein [Flagellatimonas centrodinii]ULQ45667.1 MotA/TolQ/ExbB proton channel family protein [Flagellatimonas centrodinii]